MDKLKPIKDLEREIEQSEISLGDVIRFVFEGKREFVGYYGGYYGGENARAEMFQEIKSTGEFVGRRGINTNNPRLRGIDEIETIAVGYQVLRKYKGVPLNTT